MRRAVLILAAATALLVGCDGGVESSATADAPKDPWDPCSIPASAIDAIGLDSATKETWGEGMNVPDWLLCYWRGTDAGTDYFFGIRSSSAHETSEIAGNPEWIQIATPTLAGRNGVQYQEQGSGPEMQCAVAFDTTSGVVNFDVSSIGDVTPTFDACENVLEHATAIQSHLPQTRN